MTDKQQQLDTCNHCGHPWKQHDPEDGRCDAHSSEEGVFGPCRCGRDLSFHTAHNAARSTTALTEQQLEPSWEAAFHIVRGYSYEVSGSDRGNAAREILRRMDEHAVKFTESNDSRPDCACNTDGVDRCDGFCDEMEHEHGLQAPDPKCSECGGTGVYRGMNSRQWPCHRCAKQGREDGGVSDERAAVVAYLRRDGACDCEPEPDFAGAQHGSISRCMSCILADEIEEGAHRV